MRGLKENIKRVLKPLSIFILQLLLFYGTIRWFLAFNKPKKRQNDTEKSYRGVCDGLEEEWGPETKLVKNVLSNQSEQQQAQLLRNGLNHRQNTPDGLGIFLLKIGSQANEANEEGQVQQRSHYVELDTVGAPREEIYETYTCSLKECQGQQDFGRDFVNNFGSRN